MAGQRLELLLKNEKTQYEFGSPLLLLASALYSDRETNNSVAQLKWKNIDQRTVKAVLIEIHGWDAFDQRIDSIQYQYDGLAVKQGSEFGSRTPILIKTNKIAKFTVALKAISFADGTIWRPTDSDGVLSALPEPQKQTLSGELLDQFKRDLSKAGNRLAYAYAPQKAEGLWQCGCGSWQTTDSDCLKCKSNYTFLLAASDPGILQKHLSEYKEEQAKLRIEAEKRAEEERIAHEKAEEERRIAEEKRRETEAALQRQQEALRKAKKKRNLKIYSAIVAVAILIFGGYLAYDKIIRPQNEYNQAQALLESGNLDDAYAAFSGMLDYKDSETKLLEINYKKAKNLLIQGDLEEAKQYFSRAGEYSDAVQHIRNIDAYFAAGSDYRKNDLISAVKGYRELGSFLDASIRFESIAEILYGQAKEALAKNDYEQAFSLLTTLDDYSDCATLVAKIDSKYENAIALWNNGEKLQAEQGLQPLIGWRDAGEKLVALRLEIADDAVKNENYDTALAYYGKVPSTEDIKKKIASASQGKAYQEALTALNAGKLEIAQEKFFAAGDYKDAAKQASMLVIYKQANAQLAEGKYQEAREAYIDLETFLDSATKLNSCNDALYQEATGLKDKGDYAKAYELFALISGHLDSADIAKKIRDDYKAADDLLKTGKYDEANAAFLALYNYSDSATKAQESMYQKAESLKTAGSYDDAITIYSGLEEYKDSAEKINACQYSKAESLLAGKDIDGAVLLFEGIPQYSDSAERAQALRYEKAQTLWENGDLQAARAEYEILKEYSNAPELLTKVLTEIVDKSIANKDYASALSAYQGLEQTAEIKEREYKLAQICYDEGFFEEATSAYETLGQYELSLSKLPIARYAWADQLFKEGEYAKAAEQFVLLGDMTDSSTRAKESIYQLAKSHLENKEYDVAKSHYASIPGYSDADTMCKECDYRKATDLLNEGKNKDAETIFKTLGEYSDSKTKAEQCVFNQAEILFENEKYEEAKKLYDTITYSDSATKAKQCVYNVAEALFSIKDYSGAKDRFASIDYLDSKDRAKESAYQEAEALYTDKKYAEAETVFTSVAGYNDSDDRAKDCHLQQGKVLMEAGDYKGALEFLECIDYADSAMLAAQSHYELGRILHLSGNTDAAIAEYAFALLLPEAQEAISSAAKDYAAINELEKAIQTLWLIRDQESTKTILIDIGDQIVKINNLSLACIAYSAVGNNELPQLYKYIPLLSIDKIERQLDNCNLLKEELQFSGSILYTLGKSAINIYEWDKAILAFEAAGNYCDAKTQVEATYYAEGLAKREAKDWDGAIISFKNAKTYRDAETQISQTRYLQAEMLEIEGKQEDAYHMFISLGAYKDSYERANKPYYDRGVASKNNNDFIAAAEAFAHAGSYNGSDQLSLEMYYIQANLDLNEKRYIDALDHFRQAGSYKDSEMKAINLEYKFYRLISFSGYLGEYIALNSDGRILQSNDSLQGDSMSSGIVRFTVCGEYIAGITKDGKIKLRGDRINEVQRAKEWRNVIDVQIAGHDAVFALNASGKVLAVKDNPLNGMYDFTGLDKWRDIKKILYGQFSEWAAGALIGLDSNGNLFVYDCYKASTKTTKGKFIDIAIASNKLYALEKDGSIYIYNRDAKAWKVNQRNTEDSWYKDILLEGNWLSGRSVDNDIIVKRRSYDGKLLLTLHRDGQLTVNNNGVQTTNWKLWDDQVELDNIFSWSISAPEKEYKNIYARGSAMIEDNVQGAYDLLVSVIEYEPARELINNNNKLARIRDEHFVKGSKIKLGEKNSSGLISFTVIDQKKGSILVISDSLFERYGEHGRCHFKEFKTSCLYDYLSLIYSYYFSEREQQIMLPLTSGTFKGDKLFILSKSEVQKYFPKQADRIREKDWVTSSITKRYTNELEMIVGKDGSFSSIIGDGRTMYFPIAFWLDLNQLPLAMQ